MPAEILCEIRTASFIYLTYVNCAALISVSITFGDLTLNTSTPCSHNYLPCFDIHLSANVPIKNVIAIDVNIQLYSRWRLSTRVYSLCMYTWYTTVRACEIILFFFLFLKNLAIFVAWSSEFFFSYRSLNRLYTCVYSLQSSVWVHCTAQCRVSGHLHHIYF